MLSRINRIKKNKDSALTLMELIAVLIIISIMVAISTPQYFRAREKTMDKHAQTILELIRASESQFRMETGTDYPQTPGISVTNVGAINGNLSLDLVDDGRWLYNITNTAWSGPGFVATLTRVGGWGHERSWWINATMYNASCIGSGCL